MTESARGGVAVGSQVRVVWPSPLEGLTGTVTFINDSSGLWEVLIDGGRWRGRRPLLVTRDEVELARDSAPAKVRLRDGWSLSLRQRGGACLGRDPTQAIPDASCRVRAGEGAV